MTTATKTKAMKLYDNVYVTPTGVKFTTKGRVMSPGAALGLLTKSEARRVRKAARARGLHYIAGAVRLAK